MNKEIRQVEREVEVKLSYYVSNGGVDCGAS